MKIKTLAVALFLISPVLFAQSNETADFSSLRIAQAGNDGEMLDFAVSKDQRYIAVANENKIIKLYDGSNGKFIRRINGHHLQLLEILISPDNEKIITIGFENSIAVFDLKSGNLINTVMLKNKIRCIDVDQQAKTAVVGDNKGFISFIDLENFKVVKEIPSNAPQVTAITYSPDYRQIAVGTGVAVGYMLKKNPIYLYDANTWEPAVTLRGLEGATTAIRYSYDGKNLYTGHKNNSRMLLKWDLATGQETVISNIINLISTGGYTSLDVDRENSILVATTDDRSIQIFDLINNKQISNQFASKIRLVRKLDHFPRNVFGVNDGKNFIIGGFNKNLLYIYNAEKKGVAGYIHLFNEEWAVVAADGRMDGSLEAIRNLSWRTGYVNIPLENTFDASFTPRLLNTLTAQVYVQEEFKVEQAAREIPVLKMQTIDSKPVPAGAIPSVKSSKKNITIQVAVEKNLPLVEEVRLFQNSKLVGTINAREDIKPLLTFEASLTDAFGPENYFYVTAKSKQGFDAEKSRFTVIYEGKTEEKARLFVLTIGINEYRNPKYNLNYAVADAASFETALITGSRKLFDQPVVKSIRNTKATKAGILAAFQEIQQQAKEQDLFVFYYAGHGVMSDGKQNEAQFYLVPHDITQLYGKDEMLQEKGISAAELKELSKNINAQKQVFILDACQSSGALESVALRGAEEEKAMAQLARSTGTFWITAAGSEQFATEFADLGHGVFTYSLIEGLGGKADNGDKKITIKELSAFIETRVPELSEKYKGKPQFPSGYSFGNDFPLALVEN
jgi:WD40 repeat protein